MIWGNFEKSKAVLQNIYAEPKWDDQTGVQTPELLEGCLKIEKETEDKDRIVTKTMMLE